MDQLLEFTIAIAQEAGNILLPYFGTKLTHTVKTSAIDFATEADVAAEEYIVSAIEKTFSNDDIIAEESGIHRKDNAEYTWIIDPLDGTYNFATGSKDFAVMIARAHGAILELAVVYNPALNILAHATLGNGTLLNSRRVDLGRANLADKPLSVERNNQEQLKGVGYPVTNRGASANTLATLGGERRAYVSSNGAVWDFSPPALLLAEAGFTVTNFAGDPYIWSGKTQGVIAAQPDLQKKLVATLN